MSPFVAALLVARGQDIRAAVDLCTPGSAGLTPREAGDSLAAAFARGRRQREDGVEIIRRAGDTAWEISQQREREQ